MRNLFSLKNALEIGLVSQPPMLEQFPSDNLSAPSVRTLAANYLRTHSQLVEAADRDWPEVPKAIKAVGAQKGPRMFDTFSKMLFPGAERATEQLGRSLAAVRSARLAIMIERYRRAHAKLPQSLADLQTPNSLKLPLDPFTGQDLIYRSTDSGYLVYSLGQDRQDNGGPTSEPNPYGQPADWGLRIRVFKP